MVASVLQPAATAQRWSTTGPRRESRRLPKALRFVLTGTVPSPIYVGANDTRGAAKLLARIQQLKWLAVDTEYDPETKDLICFSLSDGLWRATVHDSMLPAFAECLQAAKPTKIFHNALADVPVFGKRGVTVPIGADTMVMDFYVNENRKFSRGHGLKACASDWLGIEMREFHEVYGNGKAKRVQIDNLRQLMLEEKLEDTIEYASLDAYTTFWLFRLYRKILKASPTLKGSNLWELYRSMEVPYLASLTRMSERGIAVDPSILDAIGRELEKTILQTEWVLHRYLLPESIDVQGVKDGVPYTKSVLRDEINTNSNPHKVAIFYGWLQRCSNNPAKPFTTEADTMAAWAASGCKISEMFLALSGAQKMRHDFVGYRRGDIRATKADGGDRKGLLYFAAEEFAGGPLVVRTHVNPLGAVTGRLSMSSPNLQQIPSRETKDRYRIRRAFVARPNNALVVADFNQAELRMLAHLANDKIMVGTLREGGDLHSQTAKAAYKLSCAADEVKARYPDLRANAKAVNFGIVYGMGAVGLAHSLKIMETKAKKLIEAFFTLYKGVQRWRDGQHDQAYQLGYVETFTGRRRRLPNIYLADGALVGTAKRQAANAPIQGGVSDIMRLVMAKIDADPFFQQHDAVMLLQVHDELILECSELIDAHVVAARLKKLMENVVKLRVPLVADVHVGLNWEDAKNA